MRFLLQPTDPPVGVLAAWGRAAADAGLDGVLVRRSPALPAPLVAATALAATVPGLIVGAELALGDRHPLEVAEEIAVSDLATQGRLLVVAAPAAGAPQRFGEALDLLRRALAPRPLRVAGPTWTVPGAVAGNDTVHERAVRVTPAPAQVQVPIWCAGVPVAVAALRGLGHLAGADDEPAVLGADWSAAEHGGRQAALVGVPRARRLRWSTASRVTQELRAGREAFDQDWAVVVGPAACAGPLGAAVRPRLQLDRLPRGLEALWEADGGG